MSAYNDFNRLLAFALDAASAYAASERAQDAVSDNTACHYESGVAPSGKPTRALPMYGVKDEVMAPPSIRSIVLDE
jgi:hypothetical protein